MTIHYSLYAKTQIIELYSKGNSLRKISEEIGIPKSTIGDIVNKYKKKKTIQRLPNSGRNKVLDYDDLGILLSEVEKNPRTSAEKLSILLENSKGKKVCKQTIRNYLYYQFIH